MGLLLDVGYLLGAVLASPWILYRIVKSRSWHSLPARFGLGLGGELEGSIWLHGSSAGEVSLLRPLIRRLERDRPGAPLVISTCTTTGYAAAKKAYAAHRVILFPVDLSLVVRRFLRRFDPRLIVIVESELWPNFLLAARGRGAPVTLLNGKMSEKSRRAYAFTRIVPRALKEMTLLAVQSAEHAARFRALGVPGDRLHVTGNMKYDLADAGAGGKDARRTLRERLGYALDDVVVIGGSLHPGEHEALVAAYAALPEGRGAALVVVPRYPEDTGRIEEHIARQGYETVRKTALDRGEAKAPGRNKVLIVDTVGELGALYCAADIAFVGGSLFFRGSNKGGHNLMEPAIRGLAVLFGPYNFSFKETVEDLLAADAALCVADAKTLEAELAALVADPARRTLLGERAKQVVLNGRGASERNYALLEPWLLPCAERLQPPALDRTMPRASGHLDI
jgi:3-deoxy-D-manno-octulosonic-acid transferase